MFSTISTRNAAQTPGAKNNNRRNNNNNNRRRHQQRTLHPNHNYEPINQSESEDSDS
jgi:hypothetical protein